MVSIEDTVGIAILKSSRQLTRLLTMHLKPYKITPEQWIVLKRLTEVDSTTQKDLSQRTDKDQATLTKILDLLVHHGYVLRKPNPDDRRSFLVCITEAGVALTKECYPFVENLYSQIIDKIPEEQLTIFKDVLSKIQDNIDDLYI